MPTVVKDFTIASSSDLTVNGRVLLIALIIVPAVVTMSVKRLITIWAHVNYLFLQIADFHSHRDRAEAGNSKGNIDNAYLVGRPLAGLRFGSERINVLANII